MVQGKKNSEVWHGCGVERLDTRGVAHQRKVVQGEGHKMAAKLKGKVGVFVAAQARADNTEDFIVGVTVDAGEGCPILKQVEARSERINGIEFTRNDYAIAVHWFHRFVGDDSRLTFVKDMYAGDIKHDVVNSTELRAIGFDLKQVKLPAAPPSHRITRGALRRAALPCEPDMHYELHAECESGILQNCWTGRDD